MYDSTEELLLKIRMGEDSSFELKEVSFHGDKVRGPSRDDLADEIAAMANTANGTPVFGIFVFGIDDKTRDVSGIPLERLDTLERYIHEICNDSINPPVTFLTLRMELPDMTGQLRPVLKVDIPRSLFVHESPGGYFQRQGSSKRKMPPDLLARLFQQRSQARLIRFEEQVVPETTPADMDENLWRPFLGFFTEDPLVRLRKMKLITRDEKGKDRVTVAGILLCTNEPNKYEWLPGAFIQAVRYRGTRPDANYQIDARNITGPLNRQIVDAVAFVLKNMTIAARKEPGRVEVPQFSIGAVFEAIVNAVAHRDYSIHSSKIRLFQFDDRLEIYSPGPLPNSITIESIALRQSTRNELVTTLLSKCPVHDTTSMSGIGRGFFMEKRGEGVPLILDESRKLSGREPEYRLIGDAELLLTIYA